MHARGIDDGKVDKATLENELRGVIPTGNIACYPQLAGYYKQEISSCKAVLQAAGMCPELTRFGLHSHGQYFDWKQSIVYGSEDETREYIFSGHGFSTDFKNIIPSQILAQRAEDLLDIMGHSSYPEPITPETPSSPESMSATFRAASKVVELCWYVGSMLWTAFKRYVRRAVAKASISCGVRLQIHTPRTDCRATEAYGDVFRDHHKQGLASRCSLVGADICF